MDKPAPLNFDELRVKMYMRDCLYVAFLNFVGKELDDQKMNEMIEIFLQKQKYFYDAGLLE